MRSSAPPFTPTSARPRSVAHRACAAAIGAAVVATTLAAVAPAAAAEDAVPAPLVRYDFEGDLTSGTVANTGTAGTAFDGRMVNARAASAAPAPLGDGGQALRLPGGAQGTDPSTMPYVEIPNGVYDGAEAVTVSTWIRWDGRNGNQIPWAYVVGGDRLPADNWGTYFTPSEGSRSTAAANSGQESKAVAGAALTTDQWTHISTVVDGTTLSYYVNGALVRTVPAPVDLARLHSDDSTFGGLIGRTQWTSSWAAFFGGAVDEFTVHREALTAEQVAASFAEDAGALVALRTTELTVTTTAGSAPVLPPVVRAEYEGGVFETPVTWAAVPPEAYARPGGTFQVVGTVAGTTQRVTATVTVAAKATTPVGVDLSRTTGDFRGGATGTLYGLGDEGSPTQALVNGAWMTNISQKPPFGTQHPGGDVFNVEKPFFDKHGEDLYVYTQDYFPDWPYTKAVRPGDDRTYARGADGVLTGEWSAEPNGVWDYLEILELVTEEIAVGAEDPDKYLFIPFNEPDGIWYRNRDTEYIPYLIEGGQPGSGTPDGKSDWEAAHDVITAVYAKHGLEEPRIAGPGDSYWQGEGMTTRFLEAAVATDTVPDIYVWHELRGFAWMPDRMVEYRRGAQAAGLAADEVPAVNITEYGSAQEMSSPSNLLGWFASFEAAKVDAQTAYWTSSGTMSDNQARANAANGGWWLFNWYGSMQGSRTAAVTTGQARTIAAVDAENERAQVIYGQIPTDQDAQVTLDGLDPAVFGESVDVEVRENKVNGTDGLTGAPRVVMAVDGVEVTDGSVSLRVPNADWGSTYRVVVVPSSEREVEADLTGQSEQVLVEAESTVLDADSFVRTPGGYRASNQQDVAGFDSATSSSTFTVDVPRRGVYRLQVLGATPGVPVRHALFVDGELDQEVQYLANAVKPGWTAGNARGTAEVLVRFDRAGEHELSLRGSRDGVTPLPNVGRTAGAVSGVTLDKYVLTRVGGQRDAEQVTYPASGFRVFGGALLQHDGPDGTAAVLAGADDRIDVYPSTSTSGYHDVTVTWRSEGAAELALEVNGRPATEFTAGRAGLHRSTARVHLPQGISELELRSGDGAAVTQVVTTRATTGDTRLITVEAEDTSKVSFGGTAGVTPFGTGPLDGLGTNGTGTGYVTGLGITDADPDNEGTMTVARSGLLARPGEWDVVVHFSNDDIEGTHDYNPQVVDAGLEVAEIPRGRGAEERRAGRTTFRYTYLRSSFFEQAMPLTLTGNGGRLVFGNTKETLYIDEGATPSTDDDVVLPGYAIAPDVDKLTFARLVLTSSTTTLG